MSRRRSSPRADRLRRWFRDGRFDGDRLAGGAGAPRFEGAVRHAHDVRALVRLRVDIDEIDLVEDVLELVAEYRPCPSCVMFVTER